MQHFRRSNIDLWSHLITNSGDRVVVEKTAAAHEWWRLDHHVFRVTLEYTNDWRYELMFLDDSGVQAYDLLMSNYDTTQKERNIYDN